MMMNDDDVDDGVFLSVHEELMRCRYTELSVVFFFSLEFCRYNSGGDERERCSVEVWMRRGFVRHVLPDSFARGAVLRALGAVDVRSRIGVSLMCRLCKVVGAAAGPC